MLSKESVILILSIPAVKSLASLNKGSVTGSNKLSSGFVIDPKKFDVASDTEKVSKFLANGLWDRAAPRCFRARPPVVCPKGKVGDCNGKCASKDWIGDGFCDDWYEGHALNCSLHNFDGGDCGANATKAFKVDCLDQRAPAS